MRRRNIFKWLLGGTAVAVSGKPVVEVKITLEPGQCPECRAKEDPPLDFPFDYDDPKNRGVRYVEIPKFRQLVCKACGFHFNTTYPQPYIYKLAECLRRQALDAKPIAAPDDWGLGVYLKTEEGGGSYKFTWKGLNK